MSGKDQPKQFIAITSETLNGHLVHLYATCGVSITDENGISYDRAIEFLFSLIHKRKRTGGVVFVNFAFQRDFEFIFATLPQELKDKLFKSQRVQGSINQMEYELEQIEDDYYRLFGTDTQDFELADFERHVMQKALDEIREVTTPQGYQLELVNGKFLTIRYNGKALTIYDLWGFSKPLSLQQAVQKFLNESKPLLDRRVFNAIDFFDGETELDRLQTHARYEADCVKRLAETINTRLIQTGIRLQKFHGASAVASKILSMANAKKQFHSYKFKRQLSPSLYKALHQATFGGRAEQFKIGTLENVNVYDINSAYAYAATHLPVMLSKPRAVSEYSDAPFSMWHIEYDFTDVNPYFSPLPYREAIGNTRYKLRGAGVYWQPEVKFCIENFPDCVRVNYGYVLEDAVAPFTNEIREWYRTRTALQSNGDPIELILKLALAAIYGKFAQQQGNGYYHNLFYAGYITSFTRAQLLEATKGFEQETICFQTDAIHTRAELPVLQNNELGAYKKSTYSKVTYLDAGIYRCTDNLGRVIKTKTQGFRSFDFERALYQLCRNTRNYTALTELFIGHNLFRQNLFTSSPYLTDVAIEKVIKPMENDLVAMRQFEARDVDLSRSFLDSRAIDRWSGLESTPYEFRQGVERDAALATIEACRV